MKRVLINISHLNNLVILLIQSFIYSFFFSIMINHNNKQGSTNNTYPIYNPLNQIQEKRNFYSFGGQPPTYPFNHPYPYPPPSPFYYNYHPSINPFQGYPQPKQYPDPSFHQTKNIKPTKREIIDLESPTKVKLEQVQPEKTRPKRAKLSETSVKFQEGSQKIQNRADFRKRAQQQLRTRNLKQTFKNVMISFTKQAPNYNQCRNLYFASLKEIDELKQNSQFPLIFFETLKRKFEQFKKTKEELIKYIIRRTYHNAKHRKSSSSKLQLQRLESFHEKNVKYHKSMNNDFLKKEFSNPIFLQFYQEFLDSLDQQLEKQNQERMDRFTITLTSAWVQETLSLVQFEKKLPWIHTYKMKIIGLTKELLKIYKNLAQQELELKK